MPSHQLPKMQHCYEDKNTEECKDDAQRDLRGDHVAGKPFRHLEGVCRLRGEDEHGDKRRNEREVVQGEQRKRTPCARLAGDEREDRHVDLPRAERVEKRHEERAAEAREGDSRTAFMTPLPAAWRSPSRRGWRRKGGKRVSNC